jgi:hypothetical protein
MRVYPGGQGEQDSGQRVSVRPAAPFGAPGLESAAEASASGYHSGLNVTHCSGTANDSPHCVQRMKPHQKTLIHAFRSHRVVCRAHSTFRSQP